MSRYPHMLQRLTGCASPSQILALCAEWEWDEAPGLPQTQAARLTAWHGIGAQGRAGHYGPDRHASGIEIAALWAAIDARLKKGGTLWAFSPDAPCVWAMLGLWDQLESGALRLAGEDYRDNNGGNYAALSAVQETSQATARQADGGTGADVRQLSGSVPSQGASLRSAAVQRGARRMGYAVLECPPFVLDCRRPGLTGTLRIVDVANYGATIGARSMPCAERARLTMDFVRGMIGVVNSNGLGGLRATVGSQSRAAFLAAHLTELMQCHCDLQALTLETESYYAGRCEAFRLGEVPGEVWHLDVTAMYASIYATLEVPVALTCVQRDLAAWQVLGVEAQNGCIADVTLRTDEPCYPFRDDERRLCIWPVGEFRTTLAGAELAQALREKHVQQIHSIAYYLTAPALASYANCVLALRAEYAGQGPLSSWAKMLGNCIVGKFAQRDRRWVNDRSNRAHQVWDAWWGEDPLAEIVRWRAVADTVQREESGGWSDDAIPAVSAFICAAARMRLLAMIRCAGWDQVYYCDTDSLFTSALGLGRLREAGWVKPGAPGFLRIESCATGLAIGGIKDYTVNGRRVKAGYPVDAEAQDCEGGAVWIGVGVSGCCRAQRRPAALRHAVPFNFLSAYRHGLPSNDGKVRPIRLGKT